jgi:hypothetical protein
MVLPELAKGFMLQAPTIWAVRRLCLYCICQARSCYTEHIVLRLFGFISTRVRMADLMS